MGPARGLAARISMPTMRVFLVEDVPAMRDLIVSRLADIPGLYWAGFSDGETDALAQLLEQRCDVLIVDIELRQGNGMSMLRKLAQAGRHEDDLKIIFSNNICETYRRAGQRYGVQHFFDKSFQVQDLHALLEARAAAIPASREESNIHDPL
jgi:DNA-binding NarL/FixJ family response regulator